FSSRRRHTSFSRDWSSDVCSSDLTEKVPCTADAAGSTPSMICCVRSESAGSNQVACAIWIAANAPQTSSSCRARPETRTRINSSISATNSAWLSAANTTRPTSSATSRVMVGAVNLTGVSSSEMPAVMPNHTNAIHAGFLRLAACCFRDLGRSGIIARLCSLCIRGKLGNQSGISFHLNHMASGKESQLASAVMMIRPARFQSNPQTAESNRFQGNTSASPGEQHAAALAQFESLTQVLEAAGVRVCVFDDTPEPHTPDAIFPNNWVSFHADGTAVLYPMEAPNRRTERRRDILESLADEHGFLLRNVIDMSHHENEGHFLEGTGSMVLDRSNRIAYACLSSRTHLDPLGEFAQRMDYEVLAFDAVDQNGAAIYHTNV